MNPVAFPLEPGTRGQPLVDQQFQGVLQFLIDKGLLPLTEANRNVYSERLLPCHQLHGGLGLSALRPAK